MILHPDRLLPPDPAVRAIARDLYASVAGAPIVSPHGHVDPRLLADDVPFADPAALFVTPDHYVTRMLHAVGVPLDRLGVRRVDGTGSGADPRAVWRTFCEHWTVLAGTPSRQWLADALVNVLGVDVLPSAGTADALYDEIADKLTRPEFRPRALFRRFRVDVLATTDDPCSDLAAHRALNDDPTWHGRVVPTFRPDSYLEAAVPGWADRVARLADASGIDTTSYDGFLAALEDRRRFFVANGATATDHGHGDAVMSPLSHEAATRLFDDARAGVVTTAGAVALRRHLMFEMVRMSCDDGLAMAVHPGVLRSHHSPTRAAYGPDTGHDLPVATEFTAALRPALERFGTVAGLRLILFTVDETTFSRELAPLAGFYPSVFVGAPWWFLDTPGAMRRFREAVTDSAGFYKTAGFVDDTRAFCSIPSRHDVARRVDAGYLASLVAEHRLDEREAADVMAAIVDRLPRQAFKL
ncbi:MAG: Glucuronate isomerase [Frankiales bacterium]|nr:Glucuronate isomerase [Frankiales bacterium]